MKLLVKICALAAIAAVTGCTSTSAEWGGERVVLGADGAPLVDKDGVVQKVKEPVRLSSLRHWTDSIIGTTSLGIKKDEIDFQMQNYSSKPSEELAKVIDVSLKGAAELASKVGAAIATSGGSVAGEAGYSLLRNAISKYITKGGDVEKAKITCEGGNCTISDGTVTETCTDCMYQE